jgi:hypothetical protein
MTAHEPVRTGRPGEELMIRCAGDAIDIRIFTLGGGPARVPMPTPQGFTVSVSMLPDLIKALQAAETTARELGLIDGDAS